METSGITAEEIKRLKGLGFLRNKKSNRFSARIVTVAGRLSADQLRGLAKVAEEFGDGHVLLTTRLSAEIRGIPYEKTDRFLEELHKYGMDAGGTGSLVRPVVCCKGTTCQFGLIDTYDLAKDIHYRFYEEYHDVVLPHKFKIAVGGCQNNCVKPLLNDIGIVGCKDGYKIFIGGRWGRSYSIGRELKGTLGSKEEVLEIIEKAIRYFKENGKQGERFAVMIERIGFETVEKALLSEQ